jgi:hypothetical protein
MEDQMPFKVQTFQENVEPWVEGAVRDELVQACTAYATLTTPRQKAWCIQGMMDILDRAVDKETCRVVMEACGRRCISASALEKARRLQQEAQDLDDLLSRLNGAHIGGGHLQRKGDVIMPPMIAATAGQ